MEMFSAADEEQWKLIKRQIDQSDYYILIVAHRYGSMAGNVSFTEREYDYAVESGVPVLGFVIEPSAEWPANDVDTVAEARVHLEHFKAKIKSRMISFWSNADSLAGKVLAALSKQKAVNPRPGWVRADDVPGPEVLAELAGLGREVAHLSEENSALKQKASLEAQFSLIDSMADDVDCQAAILMLDSGKDVPVPPPYAYGDKNGGGGSGSIGGDRERLANAGVLRYAGNNRVLRLTDEGHLFAEWLIKRGRRCDYFWTPLGEWGDPDPETRNGQWFLQTKEAAANWGKAPPTGP